jgi:hypothetical protein
LNFIQHDIVT